MVDNGIGTYIHVHRIIKKSSLKITNEFMECDDNKYQGETFYPGQHFVDFLLIVI